MLSDHAGVKTLAVRMERQCAQRLPGGRLARAQPGVEGSTSPASRLIRSRRHRGSPAGVVRRHDRFELRGAGRVEVFRFMNAPCWWCAPHPRRVHNMMLYPVMSAHRTSRQAPGAHGHSGEPGAALGGHRLPGRYPRGTGNGLVAAAGIAGFRPLCCSAVMVRARQSILPLALIGPIGRASPRPARLKVMQVVYRARSRRSG